MHGEYGLVLNKMLVSVGSPPYAWGILALLCHLIQLVGITPICMGNTLWIISNGCPLRDHPHMHGEYRHSFYFWLELLGSPPYAWGILSASCHGRGRTRITPICMGNTSTSSFFTSPNRDHPHMHGEYFNQELFNSAKVGSPPYAWGIRPSLSLGAYPLRITPICMGNTVKVNQPLSRLRDHPHMHGEYKLLPMVVVTLLGSPPYAWGIRIPPNQDD